MIWALGFTGTMIILTDANSVPDPAKDRITGARTIGKRIGTHHLIEMLGPDNLNFTDIYRKKMLKENENTFQ